MAGRKQRRGRRRRKRRFPVVQYLFIWLLSGFFLGSLVLLGPARWLVDSIRQAGWSQAQEDLVMILFITGFVLTSALAALLLLQAKRTLRSRAAHWGFMLALVGVTGSAAWTWMTPALLVETGGATSVAVAPGGARFVFGPYPEPDDLERLKDQGFTAVVSLLHPAVVPFEPKLLEEERVAVAEAGLELVHAPMLPWVGSNEASLERIRELLRSGQGRYYVHCYLGRGRANLVKRIVEDAGGRVSADPHLADARGFEEREEPFERGPLEELAPDVWLIPYPNEHEFFGYLLFADVGHVVLALDPGDPIQDAWRREASSLLSVYAVPNTPVALGPGEEDRIMELAREVADLARPVAVVVPYTGEGRDTRMADAFRDAWGKVRLASEAPARQDLGARPGRRPVRRDPEPERPPRAPGSLLA